MKRFLIAAGLACAIAAAWYHGRKSRNLRDECAKCPGDLWGAHP